MEISIEDKVEKLLIERSKILTINCQKQDQKFENHMLFELK